MSQKIENEEEYFIRLEFERAKKVEEELKKKMLEDERSSLKELHYMRCPKCGMQLVEIDYKGIKIDKCTVCNGVWLDHGELEAIVNLDKAVISRLLSGFKE
jgi:rubrerythrin